MLLLYEKEKELNFYYCFMILFLIKPRSGGMITQKCKSYHNAADVTVFSWAYIGAKLNTAANSHPLLMYVSHVLGTDIGTHCCF